MIASALYFRPAFFNFRRSFFSICSAECLNKGFLMATSNSDIFSCTSFGGLSKRAMPAFKVEPKGSKTKNSMNKMGLAFFMRGSPDDWRGRSLRWLSSCHLLYHCFMIPCPWVVALLLAGVKSTRQPKGLKERRRYKVKERR